MDVVYPLKRSVGPYRELRFSVRSLRNVPHRNVVFVGGRPPWARNVLHLKAEQQPNKWLDSQNNFRIACLSDEVSDPFILMNDDFFIMGEVAGIPTLNRGTVRQVLADYSARGIDNSVYLGGMRATLNEMERSGYIDPLSFEMHAPMVVHKRTFMDALSWGESFAVWHVRTAYGALAGYIGEHVADVKVDDLSSPMPEHLPFVSTSDQSFKIGRVGHQVRSRHPEPSPYELSTARGVR